MSLAGGLFWFMAPGAGQGRNAFEPDYPVQAPPASTGPIITMQTLP